MSVRRTVQQIPIHEVGDLAELWSSLLDPWLGEEARLYFVLLNSQGVPCMHPVQISVLKTPEPERIAMVVEVLAAMVADVVPDGSLAACFVSADASPDDAGTAAWVRLIKQELSAKHLAGWPVFQMNASRVWGSELTAVPSEQGLAAQAL